jgi:hypothetical protein
VIEKSASAALELLQNMENEQKKSSQNIESVTQTIGTNMDTPQNDAISITSGKKNCIQVQIRRNLLGYVI